jgi:nucleoside-diphosphate-sugar epimerase
VDDVVEAFLRAARTALADPGLIVNICSGHQVTLWDVIATVGGVLGVAAEPAWGSFPPRPWDTTTWRGSNERALATLGWQPRTSLAEGVRRLAEWLQSEPDRAALYG